MEDKTVNEPTLPNLVKRLERLESDNRRLRRSSAVMFLGVLALFLMGHGEPAARLVEGDQIVLHAPGGPIRGELSMQGTGGARFVLYDPSQTPRIELRSSAPDGTPSLTLYDKQWAQRASLRLDEDGMPHFELYDKSGKRIWAAP
jgi:hypothetical protein